jgi:cytochrome c biogenesis protein CcmG/thiol:disulfide interchange protein DsbE
MTDQAQQPAEQRRKPRVVAYLVPIAIFAILGAFFFLGLGRNPGYIEPVLIGKQAPEFALPDLRDPNEMRGSADIAGKLALINVWGTWCQECQREHGFLMQLSESGMPILGINWNDQRSAAIDWLATLGDPYSVSVFDNVGDVAIDYGVYGAPETFLISPDGTIIAKWMGPLDANTWRTEFMPAIEAHRGAD